MKKLTVILLVLAMLASLIACKSAKDKDENNETNDLTTPVITTTEKPADVTTDSGDDTPATTTEESGADDPVPADSLAGDYSVDLFLFNGTLRLEDGGKASLIIALGEAETGTIEMASVGTYTAEGNKASCVFTEGMQRLVFSDSSAKDAFLAEMKNELDSGEVTEEEYNQALELTSDEGMKIESEDQQFNDLDVYVLDLANNAAYQCEVRNSEYVQKTEYDDNFNVIGTRYETSNGVTESKYDSEGNEIYYLDEDEDGKSETYNEYRDGNVVKATYLFDGEVVSEETYEYDDHGNETKITTVEDGETFVIEYANEYDESGNLIKVATTHNGEAYCEQFYEYFDGGYTKSSKTVYEDGSYDYTVWDEDFNTILSEYKYDDDVHSTVYAYDEDGNRVYEKETVNGVVVFEGDPGDREDDWEDWEDSEDQDD